MGAMLCAVTAQRVRETIVVLLRSISVLWRVTLMGKDKYEKAVQGSGTYRMSFTVLNRSLNRIRTKKIICLFFGYNQFLHKIYLVLSVL